MPTINIPEDIYNRLIELREFLVDRKHLLCSGGSSRHIKTIDLLIEPTPVINPPLIPRSQ